MYFQTYLTLTILILSSHAKRVIQDVYWRDYIDGYIPEDAFPSQDGLYIGQMPLNGILPGTIYPTKKLIVSECCTGRKEATDGVKIMCTRHPENFRWENVSINWLVEGMLDNLVIGGIERGQTLYIGKVFHTGEWKIGKVYPSFHKLRGLRIWTASGGLHVAEDFQILKYVPHESYIDVRTS